MKNSKILRVLAFGLVMAALLMTPGLARKNQGSTFQLTRPSIVLANQNGLVDLGTKLDQEAGISAYFKAGDVINISQVKPIFKTIEAETTDYILGSVGVSGYVENFDAHVYVHHDSRILAYYLKSDPISKIIDIRNSRINTTILKNVVSFVAGTAGMPFTDVTYYDFRYPNANQMMLIGEDSLNGNDFTIQMPIEYGYVALGYAVKYGCGYCGGGPGFYIDGAHQNDTWYGGNDSSGYGTISNAAFMPGVTHTCNMGGYTDYGVILILYRVP